MRSIIGKYGEVWYYGKDEYVGRSFHNYGEFSSEECDEINSLAPVDKLCIDIGANIGAISQMLEYNGKTCIAFEPQTEIYKLLRKNVKGNCYNIALGSEVGSARMPRLRWGSKYNYGGISLNTYSILGSYEVPVRTLDSFSFTNVGFIKIDVEGWEEEVLKGAVDTINSNKPIMYIEDDRQEKSRSLHAFLDNIGYTYELSVTPLFTPNNFFNNPKNVWDKDYMSYNLVCRPK